MRPGNLAALTPRRPDAATADLAELDACDAEFLSADVDVADS